jgi:hypothetical protein
VDVDVDRQPAVVGVPRVEHEVGSPTSSAASRRAACSIVSPPRVPARLQPPAEPDVVDEQLRGDVRPTAGPGDDHRAGRQVARRVLAGRHVAAAVEQGASGSSAIVHREKSQVTVHASRASR